MLAGAMSPMQRGLKLAVAVAMVGSFSALLALLVAVLLNAVMEYDGLTVLPCGLGAGIWLTALIGQVRWFRRLVKEFRYEDGVLYARTFGRFGERAYPLAAIGGVEFKQGRGTYWYHRIVLQGGGRLVLEPALENGVELAEQLGADLNYAPFIPAGSGWPPPMAVLMFGVGMVSLIIAGAGLFGAVRWRLMGIETVGVVTVFAAPPPGVNSWIEVAYEAGGERHVIRPANWNAGHGKPAYTVGENVPVLFLADRPEVGIVNNYREMGEMSLFLSFFAVFSFAVGTRLWVQAGRVA
jgi:hypothetical protein